jgi:broad specificity phosphatase PhoE
MRHGNYDARIEGTDETGPGESYNDIVARFMPFIGRLEETYRDTEANVLLISHATALRTMLPLLSSNVDNAFSIARPVDGTTCIVVELRDGEWVCLRWGEEVLQDA